MFFSFSFLFCYFVIIKHTPRNILTTIDLHNSEMCIIGYLVVLLHVFFLSAGSEREKYNAMR